MKPNDILSLISNPQAMYKQMIESNPQFKQFVEKNKGKTPEDIAKEYGIDPNLLKNLIKGQ